MPNVIPASVDLRTLMFPVIGTKPKTTEAIKPLVYGTAFCIAPGIFMTAAHVLQDVKSDGGAAALVELTRKGAAEAHVIDGDEILKYDLAPDVREGQGVFHNRLAPGSVAASERHQRDRRVQLRLTK